MKDSLLPRSAPASSDAVRRAMAAVGLSIAFYVLSLGVAAALIALPFIEYSYLGRIEIRLLIFGLGTGFVILRAVLPRREKFVPPGPLLDRTRQARLHEVVSSIASASKQNPPSEIYLLPIVNAWVANRGGFLGIGRRRIMGVGLPLLQLLSVEELRAILAHEFGHFWHGDTNIGPWVYQTRQSIARTVEALAQKGSILSRVFIWYGERYLRLTMSISRRQELAADQLSVRIVGPGATTSALLRIEVGAMVYSLFCARQLAPALERHMAPPLAEGFALFLERVREAPAPPESAEPEGAAESAEPEETINAAPVDPYDTHPPLEVRLVAIGAVPETPSEASPPAIELLMDSDELGDELIGYLGIDASEIRRITWMEYGPKVVIPLWKNRVSAAARTLAGKVISSIPAILADPASCEGLARVVMAEEGIHTYDEPAPEVKLMLAGRVLGAAYGLALHDAGFEIRTLPGRDAELFRGDVVMRPYDRISELSSTAAAESWAAECASLGIADVPLGPDVVPSPPPSMPQASSSRRRRRRLRL